MSILTLPYKMNLEEVKLCVNTNKGTGAGGANTNFHGKKFEEKTNNQQRLLDMGYIKIEKKYKRQKYFYLSKTFEDKTVVFLTQGGLKTYLEDKYNIESFRHPDEAYIIEYTNGRKVIKILEKKEQNVEGSVETKLMAGNGFKREFEKVLGPEFEVYYGFCVNGFYKKKLTSDKLKYKILNENLKEDNIPVLFGDDDNYFETLDTWITLENKETIQNRETIKKRLKDWMKKTFTSWILASWIDDHLQNQKLKNKNKIK